MAPRIGFIIIGHADYQNDIGLHFATRAVEQLRGRGIDVVLDTTPHTAAIDAGEAARELIKRDCDGVIAFLGTWIECSTALAAIREFEHLPFAIWGFNMFEWEGKRDSTGSFVAVCVLKGALDRMEYRHKTLIGLPEDAVTIEAADAFCRAAHAVQALKRTRLGLVGYAAMAMYPGTFDHVLLRRRIGPEVVHFDSYSVINSAEQIDPARTHAAMAELAGGADIRATDERLAKSVNVGLALEDLCREHGLDALNVKCQYEFSQEYGMTACVPISMTADRGIVSACEGDCIITATMAMLHHLTDQVVAYGDILDLQGNQMLLSSCGFAPNTGFDGLICSCTLQRGRVTFARLVEGSHGDYRLNYGTGTGVDTELRQGRFPALEVRLDGSPERLIQTMASQHFALCYGDITQSLEDLCRWLDIEPVRI